MRPPSTFAYRVALGRADRVRATARIAPGGPPRPVAWRPCPRPSGTGLQPKVSR